MKVYFNGKYMAKDRVHISPDDRGFVFGDGVYEVVACYGGRPFRMPGHIERMTRGLREIRLGCPDVARLGEIAGRLLRENGLRSRDATVYVQVTRGVAPRKHRFPSPAVAPTVYASASPFKRNEAGQARGVKAILVPDIRWTRCDIKTVGLLANVLAHQRAVDEGAYEALWVRDGAVLEGTHAGFAAVVKGEFVTAPESNYILSSITRAVTLELCRAEGIPVRELPLLEHHVREADEMMVLGTTSEITPVVQIDDWHVGNGEPGPVTRRLQRAFRRLIA